jgi:hypothetical protein
MTWPPDEYSQQHVADDQWSDVPETDDEGTPLLRPPLVSSTALEARLSPSCPPPAASVNLFLDVHQYRLKRA